MLRWKGWRERVAADPSFPYKVFIEQVGAPIIYLIVDQEHLQARANGGSIAYSHNKMSS